MAYGLTDLIGPSGIDLVTGTPVARTGSVSSKPNGFGFSGSGSYISKTLSGSGAADQTLAIWFSTTQTSNFSLAGRNGTSYYLGSQSTTTMLWFPIGSSLTVTVRDGWPHLALSTVSGLRGANNYFQGVDGRVSLGGNDGGRPSYTRFGYDSPTGDQLTGTIHSIAMWSRAMSDIDIWALYDPATRWDLYWVPGRRVFVDVGAAAFDAALFPRVYFEDLQRRRDAMIPSGRIA